MNRRRTLGALFALAVTGAPFIAIAQKSDRIWRIGMVFGGTKHTSSPLEAAFLAGMKDYGYEVGRNLIVDTRYAEGDPARYPALVNEVIALKPDVLMAANAGASLTMKSRTTTIPIVMGTTSDPVGIGLAQSLSRPGGNLTGMALQLHELAAKHIEIMAEVLPRMRRVALFTDVSQPRPLSQQYEQIAGTTAAAKGLSLDVYRVGGRQEITQALRNLETRRADALLINPSPPLNALRREICRSATDIGLPSVGFSDDWAQDGALLSFGPSFVEAIRRTAYFVDRILKGAKPSDLPIEQPTKFDLVVNAAVAKSLGISIPRSVLLRADRVIE